MKTTTSILRLAIVVLAIAFASAGSAGDYDDGMAAYEAGDMDAAFTAFSKAAEQGDAKAQTNLGVMYYEGQGVPQDYVQAHMWFNLAAASGKENAAENRDIAASNMTPAQIAEAQKLAREWKPTTN